MPIWMCVTYQQFTEHRFQHQVCREQGWTCPEKIPVVPAYVRRHRYRPSWSTSIEGLYAIGEVGCTVYGNRLAIPFWRHWYSVNSHWKIPERRNCINAGSKTRPDSTIKALFIRSKQYGELPKSSPSVDGDYVGIVRTTE